MYEQFENYVERSKNFQNEPSHRSNEIIQRNVTRKVKQGSCLK